MSHAESIANALIADADNRGMFKGIDSDIREEIEGSWRSIAYQTMAASEQRKRVGWTEHNDRTWFCPETNQGLVLTYYQRDSVAEFALYNIAINTEGTLLFMDPRTGDAPTKPHDAPEATIALKWDGDCRIYTEELCTDLEDMTSLMTQLIAVLGPSLHSNWNPN